MHVCMVPLKRGPAIVLDKAITLIGRNPDCDVVISQSSKVSRKHCCVAQVNGGYVVRDLGSMNGLWINGERIDCQSGLQVGDEVAIGDVAYRVEEQNVPELDDPLSDSDDEQLIPLTSEPGNVRATIPIDDSHELPVPVPDEPDSLFIDDSIQSDEDPALLDPDSGLLR